MRNVLADTQIQINWKMKVTLNDGRTMAGQMLAFDKVYSFITSLQTRADLLLAYEPCPCRYRRVSTR